jgi:hypothetical protein
VVKRGQLMRLVVFVFCFCFFFFFFFFVNNEAGGCYAVNLVVNAFDLLRLVSIGSFSLM